jgi:hypothetical protein
MPGTGRQPIPITHDGIEYPSRAQLARHLAAALGGNLNTWASRLSVTNGDVARALELANNRVPHIPLSYDGCSFPSRRALARYLATKLGGTRTVWNGRLQRANDDVARVVRGRSASPIG